jgi:hypothetical protein
MQAASVSLRYDGQCRRDKGISCLHETHAVVLRLDAWSGRQWSHTGTSVRYGTHSEALRRKNHLGLNRAYAFKNHVQTSSHAQHLRAAAQYRLKFVVAVTVVGQTQADGCPEGPCAVLLCVT